MSTVDGRSSWTSGRATSTDGDHNMQTDGVDAYGFGCDARFVLSELVGEGPLP
jgi:hypothetical protein